MKDTSELPGLILLGLAVIAVMFCLRFAAFGNDRSAIEAGVIAIFAAVVGSVWMFVARRRFTRIAQRSAVESEPPVAGPSGAP